MKKSHKAGLGFGIASGIITPLGLIVGLYSGTKSSLVIIGGILTIAVADAFSDSLGVHVSKETDHTYSRREIWEATLTTFASKFLFALMFVVPFLIFSVKTGVIVSIISGMILLSTFSSYIAKQRGESPWHAIGEHLGIASIVIAMTYFLPIWIQAYMG